MAVLITGGYGHIGAWTALLLARQGHDTIVYDTNDDAPECLTEVANSITFIKGDVLNLTALREAFARHHTNIDGVPSENLLRQTVERGYRLGLPAPRQGERFFGPTRDRQGCWKLEQCRSNCRGETGLIHRRQRRHFMYLVAPAHG